jgi:cytochrome o ubiquinol oxidase operon protein cyoD
MSEERSLQEIQREWPQTLRLYIIGFIGSLFLTCLSFSLVALRLLPHKILIPTLVFLALAQAFVQLVYFMHMGTEKKPRWMTLVFNFMVLVILIVVLGTLWIMSDLDNRVMPDMSNMPM